MSNLTFTIRPALPHDLDRLWPMVRRAVEKMNADGSDQWGDDYPLRSDYAADIVSGLLWVADSGDAILGVAFVTTDPEPSYDSIDWTCPSPALVIHRMAVDPDAQRSGVASALFRHAETLARDQGIPAIHMDTYSKNQGMQALMLGRGFVKRGEVSLHGRPLPFPCFEKTL